VGQLVPLHVGASAATTNGYPGCGGNSYSYLTSTNNCGSLARALWTSNLKGLGATADNLLVMHGTSADCFANNANTGSMAAFSDVASPAASGYSYCRGGSTASKTHHLYLCKSSGGAITSTAWSSTSTSGWGKYSGAAAVGKSIFFAPYNQNNVGVLDTATNVFTTVATTGDAASGSAKYAGAVAVGGTVFFTPFNQNNVGVLDTATNVFTTVATTGAAASGSDKYSGAAAVGNTIFFAPNSQNNVGVLDTTTNVFSTVATTGAAASGGDKYSGAAAVGGTVFFTPYAQNNVCSLQTYVTTWDQVVAMYDGGSSFIEIHGDMKVTSTLTLTRDVVFTGKCVPGPCTLARGNAGRHFLFSSCVTSNCAVAFRSLHFANGYSASSGGSAVVSSAYAGNISWTDCRFSGNTAGNSSVPVGGNGGAIYTTSSGAHLHFNATTFKSNTAVYHAGVGAGGAIRSSGSSITCIDCVFEDNEASWGGGAIMSGGTHQFTSTSFRSNGGGAQHGRDVYISNPSSANFHACTFQSTGSSQMFIQASTKDVVTFSGQTVMPTSIKENDALYTNVDAPSPPPPPYPPPLPPPDVPPPPWSPGATSWTSWAAYAKGEWSSIIPSFRLFSISFYPPHVFDKTVHPRRPRCIFARRSRVKRRIRRTRHRRGFPPQRHSRGRHHGLYHLRVHRPHLRRVRPSDARNTLLTFFQLSLFCNVFTGVCLQTPTIYPKASTWKRAPLRNDFPFIAPYAAGSRMLRRGR
jgi:hypothetical protein